MRSWSVSQPRASDEHLSRRLKLTTETGGEKWQEGPQSCHQKNQGGEGMMIVRSCLYVDDPFRDQYRVEHLSWPKPDAYRLWCDLERVQVQPWRDHL